MKFGGGGKRSIMAYKSSDCIGYCVSMLIVSAEHDIIFRVRVTASFEFRAGMSSDLKSMDTLH